MRLRAVFISSKKMSIKIKNSIYILILICYIKLAKTEGNTDTNVKENHQEFFNQILTLKEILAQLVTEVELLHKGFGQQADIIYGNYDKDPTVETKIDTDISLNQSEKIQEFYNNFNNKLLILNTDTEDLIQSNDNLLWNKTEDIHQIIESAKKCSINKAENISSDNQNGITKILEKLDKQIIRCNNLQVKLDNLNKQEKILEKNSENLSNMLVEISAKLDSQNQYFENLEKQLPVIQGASKTLDDYIIRKNEHDSYHKRCWESGNCRHGHHGGYHSRHSYH